MFLLWYFFKIFICRTQTDVKELMPPFLCSVLTKGCPCSSRRHSGVNHRGEEGHCAHDGVSCLTERYGLVGQRSKGRGVVLQVRVFNGQPQEVKDALVLCAAAHVFWNLVPVILVHLQALRGVRPTLNSTFLLFDFQVYKRNYEHHKTDFNDNLYLK